jgi:prephenate dehydrogenase
VVGYSKSPSTTENAKRLGVIDIAAESALLAVAGSDIVLIAVPVSATEATMKAIKHMIKPDVLFMDVGSTKGDVVAAARSALGKQFASFVPAHPIAGKESGGVQHAEATLYQGRQVILTPLPQTNPALVQKATDVWSAIGAQVLKMTPENHDAAFAAVSHLPHLLAFAGPGFRDFTRIAAGEPAVWRDILMANKAELLIQLQRFHQALDGMEALIKQGDAVALEQRIRQISDARAAWQMGAPRQPR